ncbi:MAG: hypothetical protein M1825_004412 [Sarcosagium campestre]|nr:MAG: hypothetical protein M1825_004412 [Sarcosagium campestre]
MDYISTAASIVYLLVLYALYPVIKILQLVVIGLAPVIHLLQFLARVVLFPLTLLARFETIYIYLGVATILGILTGSILHLSSNILISALNLSSRTKPPSAQLGGQDQTEETLDSAAEPQYQLDDSMTKEYADWLDKDRTKKKTGLVSQTILEEEDDSEDF